MAIDRSIFVDVFGAIVEAMRPTGTITVSSEVSGVYTLTSVNTFNAKEYVKINDIDYLIISATATDFVINTTTGIDFTDETWQALAPYYIFGHPKEIANRLSLKDKDSIDKFKKFPLIALLTDFNEKHGENLTFDYSSPINVIIVTSTEPTYVAAERYLNKFKPILYPLYFDLLKYINRSPDLITIDKNLIPHTKTDRLFWGASGIYGNEGVIFNEYMDAIEINFDEIVVQQNILRGCQ